MTDPIDETRPHPTSPPPAPGASSTESGAASGATADSGSPDSGSPDAGSPEAGSPTSAPPAGSDPRIDPDRPTTDWREPAWFPPRAKNRGPSLAALVFGLILVAVGLWFFVDRTLGIALPRIQWSTIWPVILIGIGAVVLVRSIKRDS